MPTVDHKLSLNEDQLAKLEAAKGWAKKNWKPFVAGAAVAGVTMLIFRGSRYPYSTIINNVTPAVNNVPDICHHDLILSDEMFSVLEKSGRAVVQMDSGQTLDVIDWAHPVTKTLPMFKVLYDVAKS